MQGDRVPFSQLTPVVGDPMAAMTQRWATQPWLGCLYYNSSFGATVSVAATWTQLLFPVGTLGVNYTLIDSNGMVSSTANRITFLEPGVYQCTVTTYYSGGANVAGAYHACFGPSNIGNPNGGDAIHWPIYDFHNNYIGDSMFIVLSGYAVITQDLISAGSNVWSVWAFGPTPKNWVPIRIECTMVSKLPPGRF